MVQEIRLVLEIHHLKASIIGTPVLHGVRLCRLIGGDTYHVVTSDA